MVTVIPNTVTIGEQLLLLFFRPLRPTPTKDILITMEKDTRISGDLLDIRKVINIEKFQHLQDDIADVTGLAVLTSDYKGVPVTRHSRRCEFCTVMRSIPEYRELCEKSDARGGLEAARLKRPYIYRCHMGLVDFAVPIIIENNYLGAIFAGEVFPEAGEDDKELERIYYNRERLKVLEDDPRLRNLYRSLPSMSIDKIETVAQLIYHFSTYIIEEAILRSSVHELSKTLARIGSDGAQVSTAEQKPPGRSRTVDVRTIPDFKEPFAGSNAIRPAVEYIRKHPREKIYVEKMASLCNLSSGHFSKLFKKDTGETLTRYINKIKAEEAKELLEISPMQVSEIAYHLGYEDTGYFIKLFKRHTGVTPSEYRKRFREKKKIM